MPASSERQGADQTDQTGSAEPQLHFRCQGEINVIDQIHRTQDPGIKNQKQPQGQIEDREGRFEASQRMGPTHLIELVQGEIGAGKKRAHGRPDQQNTDRAVDEQKQFIRSGSQQVTRFFPLFITHRLNDEGKKNQNPCPVCPTKTGCIK